MEIRLQKFLADQGVASRRKAEQFILDGRVEVNGKVVTELGSKVAPGKDIVKFDGKLIKQEKTFVTFMLNKPAGYVCTTRNFENEKNVLKLIKSSVRVYPVGRLDKDTTGLLLLTNDGDLAQRLTHPKYEKEKEYDVEVNLDVTPEFLKTLSEGVHLDQGRTLPAKVRKLGDKRFTIILKEGKNRQIREMCSELGFRVVELSRKRVNKLELGRLPLGQSKVLTAQDLKKL
jgi:23S rRNA pseudouridine2605 synthase